MAKEHAGQSILEMLTEQLDIQYAKFMELREEHSYIDADDLASALEDGMSSEDAETSSAEIVEYFELKGKLQGLAYAIAKLRNPYKPDIDAVKREAAERYAADEED